MCLLLADSELKATVNSELNLVDNELMKYPEYAARFKRAWKESGAPPKNQKELAMRLGCSQATVSDWVNGEKLPSMDTALDIAKKLNCCVVWLLTGKDLSLQSKETDLQGYVNVNGLTNEQRELVSGMIYQLSQNKPQNNENKPLTPATENVGGGVKTVKKTMLNNG
jgi:transcriptional regulator with XRE-family HTH domain